MERRTWRGESTKKISFLGIRPSPSEELKVFEHKPAEQLFLLLSGVPGQRRAARKGQFSFKAECPLRNWELITEYDSFCGKRDAGDWHGKGLGDQVCKARRLRSLKRSCPQSRDLCNFSRT